ncbi:MAG: PHB depolymerase family esterase [Solirubrobacteraceae bacterium]
MKSDRRRRLLIGLTACAAGLAAVVALTVTGGGNAGDGYRYQQLSFGGVAYRYVVYVPRGRRLGRAMPLVVVLHGCTMTAAQEAAATAYDQIAAARGFAVLYPDVDAIDGLNGGCWKAIWEPDAEGRGRGDAGAIAAMTKAVISRWRIDPTRVYAIGISAGGFEASRLGAAYPDLYAAIGIHSGGGYLAVTDGCPPRPAAGTGTSARATLTAMGSRAHVMPVIVFHGNRDGQIPYRCGQQAFAQWLATDDLVLRRQHGSPVSSNPSDASHPSVAGKRAYTVLSYAVGSGCPIAEFWSIDGMGHFWSGGSADPASLRFSDPSGPSASAASWAFFSGWHLTPTGPRCAHRVSPASP